MKTLILTSALSMMAMTAVAQERAVELDNQNIKANLSHERPANLSENRVIGMYRGIGTDGEKLTAGNTLYNEASRTTGTLNGNITVLAEEGQLGRLANEFGLNIVYQDSVTGMAQLNASSSDNLAELVNAIRESGMVRAARLELVEPRYELDVISR